MARSGNTIAWTLASPALCVLLLAGIIAEGRTRIQPGDAEPFHARVKVAIENIPTMIGGGLWGSVKRDVPQAATKLLRPNAIFCYEYNESTTGDQYRPLRSAILLVVQCKDARDLQGHYPKNCYPAMGQTLKSSTLRTWTVAGLDIPGTEYLFDAGHGTTKGQDLRRVYNFFVIPVIPHLAAQSVRGICPDIDAVYKSGEDYQRRYYGAAEFQLVLSDELSQESRDDVFAQIMTPVVPVIRALINDHQNPTPNPMGGTKP
jgi:hypothetical protein